MDSLGQRIKSLRREQKKTLENLADETGFSISFLSQLERGKSSATLESLKKISLALDVSPAYFFNDTNKEDKLVQHGELETKHMEKHNIFYKSLTASMDEPAFTPLFVVLKPDQNKGNLFQHKGQEFLYVIQGQLTVQIDNKTYDLNPFDSIMFDSSKEHYWFNYTDTDVKFLCVSYDEK